MKTSLDNKIKQSEEIFKEFERIGRFGIKYQVSPSGTEEKLTKSMEELASNLKDIPTPKNQNQLYESELKRRLIGEAAYSRQRLEGELYDFQSVLDIFSISKQDIDLIEPWLKANKKKTKNAIERLYSTSELKNYELYLNLDIPSIRTEAESFTANHIGKFHLVLGKFLQDQTNARGFIRDIKAVPTNNDRSYFNILTKTLAIGIPRICYQTQNGILKLKERELISLYGHEGMGHALNKLISEGNGLPYFLTKESSLVESTMESVAQFYQDQLLQDLRESPETQRELDIEHVFDSIYQEAKDIELIEEYRLKISQYGTLVLGDKSMGDHTDKNVIKKRKKLIDKVALYKGHSTEMINSSQDRYDYDGNLSPSLVSELRYCAQPVQRSLEELSNRGITMEKDRVFIDQVLLRGFWTPTGFMDNARIQADKYSKKK